MLHPALFKFSMCRAELSPSGGAPFGPLASLKWKLLMWDSASTVSQGEETVDEDVLKVEERVPRLRLPLLVLRSSVSLSRSDPSSGGAGLEKQAGPRRCGQVGRFQNIVACHRKDD